MEKEIIKGYKFRIYPNKNQSSYLTRIIDSYRFFYNQAIKELIEYKEKNIAPSKEKLLEHLNTIKISKEIIDIKTISFLLKEAVFESFKNYEKVQKDNKNLKFKSKFDKNTISLFVKQINFELNFENKTINLFNLKRIKTKGLQENIHPQNRIYITKTLDEKYFVSFNCKTTYKILAPPKEKKRIGIDLGLNSLITTSEGKTILNERILGRMQNRISNLHRKMTREKKGSRNYVKTKIALQRAYQKVTNIRNDYLNKISYRIIKENTFIGIEDLDIKAMEKQRQISKSLMDACLGIIVKDLEYKASWNNRVLVKVDRYFPSSQICSHCGYKNKKIKDLSIREWTCEKCNTHHNRDENAAKNILKEAYKIGLANIGINNVRIQKIINHLFSNY